MAGGDEHHCVARSDDHGAVGLLGQLAGFDGNTTRPDLDLALLQIDVVHGETSRLLPDTETTDQVRVPFGVLALQIVEQPPALANQLQQAAT